MFLLITLLITLSSAQSGICGLAPTDCSWQYDLPSNNLIIRGNGKMKDFTSTSIPWSSFKQNIKTIYIEGITSIGNYAFYECKSLTSIALPKSISIPEGVTSIYYRKFYACSSLKSISFPNKVTSIGTSAFSGCSSLESISIPEGVTSVEEETFSRCSSLKSVSIPEGVTSIKTNAFFQCFLLKSVSIPESVKSIGNSAFEYCSQLQSIRGGIHYFGKRALSKSRIESVVIGNGNKDDESVYVGESAFYGCDKLKSVTIKPKLKISKNSSFRSCAVKKSSFENCPNIESFIINGYVDEVQEKAFSFNGIKNVTFQYSSLLSPQICSDRNPKNYSMLSPIFSENAKLINVPKDYESRVFCPCDKYGCPIEYIKNKDFDKIKTASVPIDKIISDESSSNESKERSTSTENESSVNKSEESGSKGRDEISSGNDEIEKSSYQSSGNKENESSEKSDGTTMKTLLLVVFFVLTII